MRKKLTTLLFASISTIITCLFATSVAHASPTGGSYSNQSYFKLLNIDKAQQLSSGNGVIVAVCDSVMVIDAVVKRNLDIHWSVTLSRKGVRVPWSRDKFHGSAVSSVIVGPFGVAKNASLIFLDVGHPTDSHRASSTTLSACVRLATDLGVDIINISFENVCVDSNPLQSALDYAYKQGVVVVGAAGNVNSKKEKEFVYGKNTKNIICISGLTEDLVKFKYSNHGAFVDFSSPGVNLPIKVTSVVGGTLTGTSFAAPTVAGIIALMKGVNPFLNPDEIYEILKLASVDIEQEGWDVRTGYGYIDALKAVQIAKDQNLYKTLINSRYH